MVNFAVPAIPSVTSQVTLVVCTWFSRVCEGKGGAEAWPARSASNSMLVAILNVASGTEYSFQVQGIQS